MKLNFIKVFCVICSFFLLGCQAMMYGTAKQLNQISVGMSRDEVVKKLGRPDSTAANEDEEFLIYRRMEAVISDWPKDYFVKIRDGKVLSYGAKGDFDSTKDPTQVIKIEANTKNEDSIKIKTDKALADKLRELNGLKAENLITQKEFDEQKAKLLNEFVKKN